MLLRTHEVYVDKIQKIYTMEQNMKYVWLGLKILCYSFLAILLVLQFLAFLGSSNTKDFLIRGSILLVVGLYFAIKWQKKNRKADASTEDKLENS